MKRIFAVLLTILLVTSVISANDSEYYAEGNQLVPMHQSQISIKKELLSLQLKEAPDDGPEVEVDVFYEYYNPGPSTTILMGFETCLPYPFDGDEGEQDGKGNHFIKNFSINLNNKSLPFKCAMVDAFNILDKDGNIQPIDFNEFYIDVVNNLSLRDESQPDTLPHSPVYAYYFNATFKPGLNKLHHHYTYSMGGSVERSYFFDYLLTPATRWANGKIDDFTLEIVAKDRVWSFAILNNVFNGARPTFTGIGACRNSIFNPDTPYAKECMQFFLADGKATIHLKNFKPKEELSIVSNIFIPDRNNAVEHLTDDNTKIKEMLKRDGYEPNLPLAILGVMDFIECTSRDNPKAKEEYLGSIDPFTKKILRNLPYAARGRVFNDKALNKFFQSMWWYVPDPTGKAEAQLPLSKDEYWMVKTLK